MASQDKGPYVRKLCLPPIQPSVAKCDIRKIIENNWVILLRICTSETIFSGIRQLHAARRPRVPEFLDQPHQRDNSVRAAAVFDWQVWKREWCSRFYLCQHGVPLLQWVHQARKLQHTFHEQLRRNQPKATNHLGQRHFSSEPTHSCLSCKTKK